MGAVAAFIAGMLALSCAIAQDKPAAGKLDFVEGDAIVEPKDGQARIARTGDPVYQADTITTFAAAEVHVAMADGAELAVRENTKVTITVYVANGDDDDRSLLDLARGTLRAVTGWIGKYRRSGYQIRTPMVTIGVRGTDHEPLVIPVGSERGEPGTYDHVHAGAVFVRTPQGSLDIGAGQVGFAPRGLGLPPEVLAVLPTLYQPTRNEGQFAGLNERIKS
ncbi:MAG TPA: FecR domain-containing protein, partial [Burkholderiales bacterium]|nr:FecR domain-containing protein [Burkholderiales bacterium]